MREGGDWRKEVRVKNKGKSVRGKEGSTEREREAKCARTSVKDVR